jgi:hypothetical protein
MIPLKEEIVTIIAQAAFLSPHPPKLAAKIMVKIFTGGQRLLI